MNKKLSNSWWDSYRKTVKATKRFRELVRLVGNKEDTAQNMLDRIKQEHPGREDIWYLNKLIAELKEENRMNLAY